MLWLFVSVRECSLPDVTFLVRVFSFDNFVSFELGIKDLLILTVESSYREVFHKNRRYAETVLCCSLSAPMQKQTYRASLENRCPWNSKVS